MVNKKNLNRFNLKKQEKKIIFIFIATIFFYSIFIFTADLKKIIRLSAAFNWAVLPIILSLSLLNYVIRGLRFHYYLKKISIKLKFKTSLKFFLAGLSMTVTPGKAGEVIKAYLVKKQTGNRISQVIPLVVVERVTDGVAMILLGLGGIYFLKNSIIFFLLSSFSIIAFFLFIHLKDKIIRLILYLENKIGPIKVLDYFVDFFKNSKKLLTGENFIIGVVLGITAWFLEGLALYTILNQFSNIGLLSGMEISLFIFSFSSIAGFFAFIPGGIGVAEGSITYLLSLFLKLSLSQAVFITVLFRFATLWFGVSVGLTALIKSLKTSSSVKNRQ